MKKPGIKIKIFFSVCLLLVMSLLSGVSVMGKVMTTEKSTGESGTVFVAGNPDLYPLEYYDKKDKCYKGVMPALLDEISRELEIDFVYVSAGTKDVRVRLAKNRQVEVVSGCMLGENQPGNTIAGYSLFPITIDGKTYEVGFVYTELATEALRDKMEAYLSGREAWELMSLLMSKVTENQNRGMSMGSKLALIFEILLLVVVFFVLRRRRKRREEKEGKRRKKSTEW